MYDLERAQGYAVSYPLDDMLGGEGQGPSPLRDAPSFPAKERVGAFPAPPSLSGSQSSLLDLPLLPNQPSDPYYVLHTANLPSFDSSILNPVTTCKPKFIVCKCGCGKKVHPRGCQKNNCVKCTDFLTLRRARSAHRRFELYLNKDGYFNREQPLLYTIFTVPEEHRERLTNPKELNKLKGNIWKILLKFGARFGLCAVHPIAEDYPETFHPHFNFLWVQNQNFSAYLDTERLRAIYNILLNVEKPKLNGTPQDIVLRYRHKVDYTKEVYIYHKYSDEPKQIWKWCHYVVRVFPHFTKYLGSIKWFGKFEKAKLKAEYYCEKCGKKIIVEGYIEADVMQSYNEWGFAHGLSPPWEDDDKIIHFKPRKRKEESQLELI